MGCTPRSLSNSSVPTTCDVFVDQHSAARGVPSSCNLHSGVAVTGCTASRAGLGAVVPISTGGNTRHGPELSESGEDTFVVVPAQGSSGNITGQRWWRQHSQERQQQEQLQHHWAGSSGGGSTSRGDGSSGGIQ